MTTYSWGKLFRLSSLTRNQRLWISSDDGIELARRRILFVSQYPESEFRAQLERSSLPLGKNEKLAKMCLAKYGQDPKKPLNYLNQALLLAEEEQTKNR
jgi:hypothetical protein